MKEDKPGKTDYGVSPQEFIEAWQTSSTAQEVSDKLGMPKPIVHARATNYRQLGVKLKKLNRTGKAALDVEHLNSLIEGITPKDSAQPKRSKRQEQTSSLVDQVIASLGDKK